MKNERIYAAIGAVDEELLDRCEAAEKPNKTIHWRRWSVLAACLCLVIIGVIIVKNSVVSVDAPEDGIVFNETTDSIYATPEPGTWSYSTEVAAALEEYAGQDVKYYLMFDISSDSNSTCVPTSRNSADIEAELKRLTDLGYDVEYTEKWTYGYGIIPEDKEPQEYEKVYYKVAAGYFTAEQLENFAASPDYGYFFDFIINGDGSPVEEEEGIISHYSYGEGVSRGG